MPQQTVPQTLADPNFQGLPPDQQKIVLGKLDPNFAGLPPDQQDLVLQHGKQPAVTPTAATPGPLDRLAQWGQKTFKHLAPQDMQNEEAQGFGMFGAPVDRFLANTVTSAANTLTSAPAAVADWVTKSPWTPKQSAQQMADRANAGTPFDLNAPVTGADVSDYASEKLGGAIGGAALGEGAALGLKALGKIASKGKSIVTGGTKAASTLNDATLAANADASADAATKNAKIQSDRTKTLNDHFQAIQQAKGETPTTVGTLPDDSGAPPPPPRPMNARELASHKEALNAGVQQLDQQFKSDLINTAKDAKQQLDNKYDTVRAALEPKTDPETGEITPAPSVPSSQLAQAVNNAEAKLMGSSENIKQFKDIISKHPDSDPDFVTDKTPGKNNLGTVPRGNPLFDIIKEAQGGAEGPGATFRDLQGYYTELGDKLSSGGLQGDVYQAMKSLHDDIGGMMKKMAADNGVGSQLADAQDYARNYYADWRDPASPLYKAIKKAPERGQSIGHFQGADQSGIGTLAKYNPELAKRANTIRGYQQQAKSINAAPFVEKPVSALAPSTPQVQPDIKTIGPEDIRSANRDAVADRAEAARSKGISRVASGLAAFDLIRNALHGNWEGAGIDIAARGGLAAGQYGYAKLLENPKVVDWLSKPTPAQAAMIDPSVARDLQPLLQQAKAKGIRISPAISAAVSAHATKTNWYDQPNP